MNSSQGASSASSGAEQPRRRCDGLVGFDEKVSHLGHFGDLWGGVSPYEGFDRKSPGSVQLCQAGSIVATKASPFDLASEVVLEEVFRGRKRSWKWTCFQFTAWKLVPLTLFLPWLVTSLHGVIGDFLQAASFSGHDNLHID